MKHLQVFILIIFSTGIFAQNGKISGMVFMDYFYNISRESSVDSFDNTILNGKKDFNGFQIRRIYFTYDYKISETFNSRVRIEADQTSNTSNNKIGIFVKDAFINWRNIIDGSDLIIGIQPGPAFEISESVWGYRSLEKTILDLRGIVSSRDFGISLRGKLDNSGDLNYWVMAGNNSGNSPEMDKYKRFYGHLHFKPLKNISLTLYSDFKIRPSFTINSVSLSNNDITTSVFTGYNDNEKFAAGIESFMQFRENGYVEPTASSLVYQTKNALGISVFSSYNFSAKTSAVVRYDYFDPNTDPDFGDDSRNFFIFSFVYKPDASVYIMPNLMIETYESSAQSYDASVTGRITLHYNFL